MLQKIDKAARMVDKFLLDFIERGLVIPNLHPGIVYALGLDQKERTLRGKRIRPALGILVCETLGGAPGQILPFASAIELFHNFTLVHDDIEDGDAFRRNRPCVYIEYGLSHGINIGDFMLVKVFRALTEKTGNPISPAKRLKLLRLMIDAFEHTHVGQALDINARASRSFTIEQYLHLVTEKTGYCLAAPMVAAAVITGAPSPVRRALSSYANAIGPLFQIRDDVIDLTRGKGRKITGSDIREGKRSYLVAHVTQHCTKKEKLRLYKILDAPRSKTNNAQVKWVSELFQKYHSIEAACAEDERLFKEAIRSIEHTPPKLKRLLQAFAGYLKKRNQ